jgi:ABC-2 type transport system permease protein
VDSRIVRFLDRYVSLSDHLSLEYTDPDVYPSVLSKYGVEANTIVVTCAATGRQENVSIGDIIGYDQMAYLYYQQYKETTFDAEGLLTSAVDGVLSETAHKVYTTTGHGEGDLPSSIQELFKKAHMTVSSVNLLSGGGIPSDCELLILNAPSKDLANDELAAVESYLAKGGQVIYTMASKLDKLTNFNKLCADYGMSVADGMIMDTQRCYQDKYFLFFPVADTSVDVASGLTEDATHPDVRQPGHDPLHARPGHHRDQGLPLHLQGRLQRHGRKHPHRRHLRGGRPGHREDRRFHHRPAHGPTAPTLSPTPTSPRAASRIWTIPRCS